MGTNRVATGNPKFVGTLIRGDERSRGRHTSLGPPVSLPTPSSGTPLLKVSGRGASRIMRFVNNGSGNWTRRPPPLASSPSLLLPPISLSPLRRRCPRLSPSVVDVALPRAKCICAIEHVFSYVETASSKSQLHLPTSLPSPPPRPPSVPCERPQAPVAAESDLPFPVPPSRPASRRC